MAADAQPNDALDAAREQAMRWLARREYAHAELRRRLRAKGHSDAAIDSVLQRLQDLDLQSDQRFAEAYIRARSGRGYGPLRIRAELGERGVDGALIASQLDPNAPHWQQQASDALLKRFPQPPTDPSERARRERFLRYRGFEHRDIAQAMANYR